MMEWFHHLSRSLRQLGWAWALGISVGATVVTLALAAFVVVRWPPDQFTRAEAPAFMTGSHPILRALGIVAKNLGGVVLVIVGAIMALPGVPGQGFLTMLIGLTLLDFPGKRAMERALVRRPAVLRGVNTLRARFQRPPLHVE